MLTFTAVPNIELLLITFGNFIEGNRLPLTADLSNLKIANAITELEQTNSTLELLTSKIKA